MIDQLCPQVGELLVQQRRALADRFQLLCHAGEQVGGLANMQQVLIGQPVDLQANQHDQRIAIGRYEPPERDRLRPDRGDPAAQLVDIARVQLAFAAIDLVAQADDLRVHAAADCLGKGRHQIPRIGNGAAAHHLLDLAGCGQAAAADRDHPVAMHPGADRDQAVSIGRRLDRRPAQVDQRPVPDLVAPRPRFRSHQRPHHHLRNILLLDRRVQFRAVCLLEMFPKKIVRADHAACPVGNRGHGIVMV